MALPAKQQLGIAPLVIAAWGGRLLLLGGSIFAGLKLYQGFKRGFGNPSDVLDSAGHSLGYFLGALASNYLGPHIVPERFIEYKWIPTTALAGYGIYDFAKELEAKRRLRAETAKSNLAKEVKELGPQSTDPFRKSWSQAKKDLKITNWLPMIVEAQTWDILANYMWLMNIEITNISVNPYMLDVRLYKAFLEPGTAKQSGTPLLMANKVVRVNAKSMGKFEIARFNEDLWGRYPTEPFGDVAFKYRVYLISDEERKFPILETPFVKTEGKM